MAIDKDGAVRTALRLLDEHGLEKLTLRRIATELGVQAPALYWHFDSKRALLDRMTDAMLADEVAALGTQEPDEPWLTWLRRAAFALRNGLLAHTDGGRVASGARLGGARALGTLLDRGTDVLHRAGLPLEDALWAASTLLWFVVGNTVEEQSSPDLAELNDPANATTFPALTALAELTRQPGATYRTPDEAFEYTLGIVLAGISSTVNAAAQGEEQ